MLDLRQFLVEITSDDSWELVDSVTLINSMEREAVFHLDGGQVSLAIDGRPIYVGSAVVDFKRTFMDALL